MVWTMDVTVAFQMQVRIEVVSVRLSVCPSVLSVGPSRVIFVRRIWPFFSVKSSNDIINNDTMSDDEVAASDVLV